MQSLCLRTLENGLEGMVGPELHQVCDRFVAFLVHLRPFQVAQAVTGVIQPHPGRCSQEALWAVKKVKH